MRRRAVGGRSRAEPGPGETEARYRDLYENAPDMHFSMDAATERIIQCNKTLLETLGYSRREVVQRSVLDLYDPCCHGRLSQTLASFRETGQVRDVELRVLRKNGGSLDVSLSASAVRDAAGRIVASRSSWRDISDRRRAERQLEKNVHELQRSNAELEQFACVASHDLKEPLRLVVSYARLLRERYGSKIDDQADEYIRYAIDGAERMEVLLEDLLEHSRVGAAGEASPTWVDLNEVLVEALAHLEASLDETGGVVTTDVLPVVRGDRTQLRQLLQNLVGNAIKFHGERPPAVHLSAGLEATEWSISVRDNGIGIAPSFFDRIFVIFQRLHPTSAYPGSGVGLATARKIVESHGGRIWVESTPGHGATFSFTLPAQSRSGEPGGRASQYT